MASRPDDAASAALGADVRRPVTFAFLDIDGEPLRVTNAPYSFTFANTGDEDLDGYTFEAVNSGFVSVGAVQQKEGGGDTVTLTLSGLAGVDEETMNLIGDKSKWRGRDARLWRAMLDPTDLTRIGAIWDFHSGYMSVPKITGDSTSQLITLDVETYLAFFGQASGRTYLSQSDYDPGDLSAQLAIAVANGANNRS